MSITSEIIHTWAEFTKLHEERDSWNLGSWDYTFHRYNEKILELTETYDIPENVLIIYLKNLFFWHLKEFKISLFDMFENNIDLSLIKKLYTFFNEPEVIDNYNAFCDNLNYISSQLMKKDLIGNIDFSKTIEHSLDVIYDELMKCHLEIYQKGNQINLINSVCTELFVFDTVVECLTVLQNKPDAIYICYISNHNTSDGYFGFFIKNNGNLFSINERVEEAFIGQHANGRNHRFVDRKTDGFFPYELFDFSNYDYLGYAKTYTLKSKDGNKIVSLTDLSDDKYTIILLVIMLLKMRFENKELEGPIKYSNFYNQDNINLLQSSKNNELMIVNNNQIITQGQNVLNDICIKLTSNNVIMGQFNTSFDKSIHPELSYREKGYFGQSIFIDLYGEGFELDNSKLLIEDNLKLLSSSDKDISIHAEFIGTKKEMELQIYQNARKQLAVYIKQKMKEELESFKKEYGSVQNWYNIKRKEHIEDVTKFVVQGYVNAKYQNKLTSEGWRRLDSSISYSYTENCNYLTEYDKYNGKKCNCQIAVSLSDWKDIETIIGEEVPKIIKGWEYSRNYNGNPNLDVVDPCMMIYTPFESRSSFSFNFDYCDFSFRLYFSKSGLKKYIKDNNIVPTVEEEDEYKCEYTVI